MPGHEQLRSKCRSSSGYHLSSLMYIWMAEILGTSVANPPLTAGARSAHARPSPDLW